MSMYIRKQTHQAGRTSRASGASSRRRGVTSLLAMLFLIVFASLALGFYAQTNMSVQVSNNERRSKESLAAAEAGLQFIRYQLSRVTIPMQPFPNPQLTDDQVFEELAMDLQSGITEAAVSNIIYDTDPSNDATEGVDPPRIEIPASPDAYIAMTDNGPWFRVRIEQDGRDVVVTTTGKSANGTTSSGGRGVQVRFKTKEWPNRVFSYGMASQGKITLNQSARMIRGDPDSLTNVLSLFPGPGAVTIGHVASTAASPTGIEGTVTVVQGTTALNTGTLALVGTGYSVAGKTTAMDIQSSVIKLPADQVPEWPTVDTSVFESFATNQWVAGKTLYENIYIPPNSNPTFDNTMKVHGVVVVHQPNKVNFEGGVAMTCVIVGKDDPAVANDYTLNYIRFAGTGLAKNPLSALPNDPKWDELRKLTGTFLVAPGFDAIFTGTFAGVMGSVAADRVSVTGASTGTFTGSIVTLSNQPLTISGAANVTFAKPAEELHPGMRFTERFAPKKGSYKEVSASAK